MTPLVCLSLTRSALSSVNNNLYLGERHAVIWGIEEKAIKQFNKYGDDWENNKGHSGKWLQPTHRHRVTVSWRFTGIENGVPVFEIGLVECRKIKTECLVVKKHFGKLKRGIIATIGLLGILTMLFHAYSSFNTAITPFW